MTKRFTNFILLFIGVIAALFFNIKTAFCQDNAPVSIDGERYFSAFGEVVRETPELFTL